MLSVGVLVTSYNTWELALDCVRAHRRLHGAELGRIVLLDDCSPQPAPPGIENEPGIEIIRNERNLGFSANLNRGVRRVGADLVLIFDADAFPLTPYLDGLRRAFDADPRLAVLGFRTQDANGHPTASAHAEPGALSLVLGLPLLVKFQRFFPDRETRLCITTAAMAVRRSAFDEAGGFDENLKWLDVDLDYSMTLHRTAAWTVRLEPSLLARHEHGGTPVSSRDRLAKFYACRWYLLRKHGKIPNPRLTRSAILARLALEWAGTALFGRWLYPGDPARRREKLRATSGLLTYCWRSYG